MLNYHWLPYLQSLKLKGCRYWQGLPPMGHLQYLSSLHLEGMDAVEKVGRQFYGAGHGTLFPSLQVLELSHLSKLTRWTGVEDIELFHLKLSICHCPSIKEVSSLLSSLMELNVEDCLNLRSLDFRSLASRQELKISNCPRMTEIVGYMSYIRLNEKN